MRSIFAPLAFESTAPVVTDSALRLARALDGHVVGHHVRQRFLAHPPLDFFTGSYAPATSALRAHQEATVNFARMIRVAFEERCDALGAQIVPINEPMNGRAVTASWTDETGDLPSRFALAARAADLVVTAIPGPNGDRLEHEVFEALLLRSGTPVFLVPRDGLHAVPCRPLIAWDGSLLASRAIREAKDVLETAREVVLITIAESEADRPSADAIRIWLERKGLTVTVRPAGTDAALVARQILDDYAKLACDLLIIGADFRSPLEDGVLSNLARHMLASPDHALLMVH